MRQVRPAAVIGLVGSSAPKADLAGGNLKQSAVEPNQLCPRGSRGWPWPLPWQGAMKLCALNRNGS
jgi:hypothetical protein